MALERASAAGQWDAVIALSTELLEEGDLVAGRAAACALVEFVEGNQQRDVRAAGGGRHGA